MSHSFHRRKVLRFVIATYLALVLAVGACIPVRPIQTTPVPSPTFTDTPALPTELPQELGVAWEAWQFLSQDYVDPDVVTPEKLKEGAIAGMKEAVSLIDFTIPDPPKALVSERKYPEEWMAVWYAWQKLVEQDAGKTPGFLQRLKEGAIQGMARVSEDPHTAYLEPDTLRLESDDFRGSFSGIGATVSVTREGQVVIIAPLRDTPAERSGLRAGDVILEIDGQSTKGMTLYDAVARIRGPRGTSVRLTIRHGDEATPVELVIVRDNVTTSSVTTERPDALKGHDALGYIRIGLFSERTPEEFRSALRELYRRGQKGLILDLRGNPGGLLDQTVQIASEFLNSGVVLYELGRTRDRTDWRVRRGGLALDLPLVVLVDAGSASGSEVLAGALQDHNRAPLIGVQTYGKGEVGIVRRLSDGSGLSITVARWYTPSGRQINLQGLTPDIVVVRTGDDRNQGKDPQLEKAIEHLESAIQIHAVEMEKREVALWSAG